MMDWLKATAAAFTAVSLLVGICMGLLSGSFAFLERNPDIIQDYRSPDGQYIATIRTKSRRWMEKLGAVLVVNGSYFAPGR
jgi:hypothetical protein